MRMYDLIRKKKNGLELTDEEIHYFIRGYTDGEIPDYQVSALLMAVCFRGMSERETVTLTREMLLSGDVMDLSAIDGIKVDKHSTGGVGDKTTMIAAPIAASCGVKIAKMSGRGLGHTGGTIDKLESIPGLSTELSMERFTEIVERCGMAVAGQTKNLCPADKKLYALRDVTATVESLPLIASSVMSKKLASGSDAVLLDVKSGKGAFMKTREESAALARAMVNIGRGMGRKTVALVTNMNKPLGNNIGNALEVAEACETLRGRGEKNLTALCRELSAHMIRLGGKAHNMEEAYKMSDRAVADGSALLSFARMAEAQGGDPEVIMHTEKLTLSSFRTEIKAPESGYILELDAEECGIAAMELGAGRKTAGDSIDPGAGIVLASNKGDRVEKGQTVAVFYTEEEGKAKSAGERFLSALKIGSNKPEDEPLIFSTVE